MKIKLADLGVSKTQSSRWMRMAALPADKFEAALRTGRPSTTAGVLARLMYEASREERLGDVARASTPSMKGLGRFAVILADPPWRLECGWESIRTENHYPTMELSAICALPVADLAYRDCALFLWSPSASLADAMAVIDAWDFEYKTCAANSRAGV